MTNYEKYVDIFRKTLNLVEEDIKEIEELEYNCIPTWDSVGHMELISEIEDIFDIIMETDDIVDFSSFKTGIELLKKYDIYIKDEINNEYEQKLM